MYRNFPVNFIAGLTLAISAHASGSSRGPGKIMNDLLNEQHVVHEISQFGTQPLQCAPEAGNRRESLNVQQFPQAKKQKGRGLSLVPSKSLDSLNSLKSFSSLNTLNGPEDWQEEMNILQDKIWVDLSPSSRYELPKDLNHLTETIDLYHEQEKTLPGNIFIRKKLLQKIDRLCQSKLGDPNLSSEDRSKLQAISQTALNKYDYLNELKDIKKNTLQMIAPNLDKKTPTAKLGKAFILENEETNNKWELLEHLDPALRSRTYLGPLFQEWKGAIAAGKQVPSFFYWLEGQDISQYRGKQSLSPEIEATSGTSTRIVDFKKGKATSQPFYTRNPKVYSKNSLNAWNKIQADPLTHAQEGRTFFEETQLNPNEKSSLLHYAIDETGTLFIRHKSPYHSYILRGKPVISSGMITFRDGKIDSIDNESGHYTPSNKQFDAAIEKLKSKYDKPEQTIFSNTFKINKLHEPE
jgi:hypothetical protein